MNPLRTLIVKELKDLIREPQILVGIIIAPIIMFSVLGGVFSAAFTSVREAAAGRASLAILDLDRGVYSLSLTETLKAMGNLSVLQLESSSVEEALEEIRSEDLRLLLLIPKGFTENLTLGLRARLKLYVRSESLSVSSIAPSAAVEAYLNSYETLLVYSTLRKIAPNVDPNLILNPVDVEEYTVFRDSIVKMPPSLFFQRFYGQSFMMPFAVFMVIVVAMQIAATSMAKEKEGKTLEVLLTLPVKRIYILAGKLTGSILIALLGSASYMAGFAFYIGSFQMIPVEELSKLEIPVEAVNVFEIPVEGYLILGLLLFLSLVAMLSIAVGLAALAEDVRSAQSLLGVIFVPLIIPMILTMIADPKTLPTPLQTLVYAIPFSYPMIAVNSILTGDYFTPLIGAAYLTAFTLVVLYISAWFFGSEKILTAKLKFRRLKLRS